MNQSNLEIEVRFLNIDKSAISKRLKEIGAKDLGEDLLREIIFYNKSLSWRSQRKFVRLRQTKKDIHISYKHKPIQHSIDIKEIEVTVDSFEKGKLLLQEIGLTAYREQEKRRHTYKLGEVIVDIDTWPKIPTYLELEGPSEEALRNAARLLDLEWADAVFAGAGYVIEHFYKIPVTKLKHFTFDKVE